MKLGKLYALGLLAALLMPLLAHADTSYFDLNNRVYLVSKSTQTFTLGTEGAGTFNIVYQNTPVAKVNSSGIRSYAGFGLNGDIYVPTPAATPATSNQIKPGLNAVATAAANVAMYIGDPTPVAGQAFTFINGAGNAVRLKAAGGATLNGATAGGYIVVAVGATVQCYTQSATNQVCLQPVIPTPAGP